MSGPLGVPREEESFCSFLSSPLRPLPVLNVPGRTGKGLLDFGRNNSDLNSESFFSLRSRCDYIYFPKERERKIGDFLTHVQKKRKKYGKGEL